MDQPKAELKIWNGIEIELHVFPFLDISLEEEIKEIVQEHSKKVNSKIVHIFPSCWFSSSSCILHSAFSALQNEKPHSTLGLNK